MSPDHLLVIDIDALRPDVFQLMLEAGELPHLATLLGGADCARGVLVPVVSTAPSITFCAQASLFTGQHPGVHGISGSQFFDRFGLMTEGRPRYYAFDVGDIFAVDDAVLAFTKGLAGQTLQAPTIYEELRAAGREAIVAGHMYGRGASTWLSPSVISLARFTKGGSFFGLGSADYDRHVLDQLLTHIRRHGLPPRSIVTMYFLGIDHDSHAYGPGGQAAYLLEGVEPMVGELWSAMQAAAPGASIATVILSDHGQIEVPSAPEYGIRLGFPVRDTLNRFFDALGLDVYDHPLEDVTAQAVMALNGGLAHVYLRRDGGAWATPPRFEEEVLRVGTAFWEAHTSGAHVEAMRGTLAAVLVRNVARDGWGARYQALQPDGTLVSLETWFAAQPPDLFLDPVSRLDALVSPTVGDIIVLSDYGRGHSFAVGLSGIHGGLHPEESWATLAYGWPTASEAEWQARRAAILKTLAERCAAEGGRQPALADMAWGLKTLLNDEHDPKEP